MATGDVRWFSQALHDLGNKVHDLDGDDYRMAVVTTAVVPTVNTNGPHFGGAGATNFATNQVAIGTGYTGPIVLTAEAWTKTATGGVMDFGDISIPQDASGFSNGAWGIIYNHTDANRRAIGFVELSAAGSLSNVLGPVNVTIIAGGALELVQA